MVRWVGGVVKRGFMSTSRSGTALDRPVDILRASVHQLPRIRRLGGGAGLRGPDRHVLGQSHWRQQGRLLGRARLHRAPMRGNARSWRATPYYPSWRLRSERPGPPPGLPASPHGTLGAWPRNWALHLFSRTSSRWPPSCARESQAQFPDRSSHHRSGVEGSQLVLSWSEVHPPWRRAVTAPTRGSALSRLLRSCASNVGLSIGLWQIGHSSAETASIASDSSAWSR